MLETLLVLVFGGGLFLYLKTRFERVPDVIGTHLPKFNNHDRKTLMIEYEEEQRRKMGFQDW